MKRSNKSTIKLILYMFIMLLMSSKVYPQNYQLVEKYYIHAKALSKQGKYLQAAQMFAKSSEAEKLSTNPRLLPLSFLLSNAGKFYYFAR